MRDSPLCGRTDKSCRMRTFLSGNRSKASLDSAGFAKAGTLLATTAAAATRVTLAASPGGRARLCSLGEDDWNHRSQGTGRHRIGSPGVDDLSRRFQGARRHPIGSLGVDDRSRSQGAGRHRIVPWNKVTNAVVDQRKYRSRWRAQEEVFNVRIRICARQAQRSRRGRNRGARDSFAVGLQFSCEFSGRNPAS